MGLRIGETPDSEETKGKLRPAPSGRDSSRESVQLRVVGTLGTAAKVLPIGGDWVGCCRQQLGAEGRQKEEGLWLLGILLPLQGSTEIRGKLKLCKGSPWQTIGVGTCALVF